MSRVEFCTIASGSSGNSNIVGIGGLYFLVDAGISGKRMEHAMQRMNVHSLSGIFLTHEHRDHIAGAGVMARRYKVKLYATPLTWRYFAYHRSLGALDATQINIIEPYKPIVINDVTVTAFDIRHDAAQPVGYTFESAGKKIATATDLGCATDTVRKYLTGANILLLESNHDVIMLKNGPYHHALKERVASSHGHLSNADAGVLLTEVAGAQLEYVFLSHLSEDNNTPVAAYDTVKRILDVNGVTIKNLLVAERHNPGVVVQLGE